MPPYLGTYLVFLSLMQVRVKLFLAFVAVQYATADRVRESGKMCGIAIIHIDTEICILSLSLSLLPKRVSERECEKFDRESDK
jgi:hypothetical protein